ncbi:SDR family NAD(P)-dependent oxidoreductase [Hoeflea ulvae]|uniref:SDR family NAD(P)-dependent oxidoreductase n=1 Tax=Hoeflea ulvae TaxID=2983764 RepID=A0ABT3YKE2_9HYPH|nr:SDR family NAD(P)-dependent oxidoreductase [Hoeflea ulvae]MCY0096368.1 SDR family NAD(P)-dependent oxidoreductase [Hoeflea ulvae]
MHVVITGGSSGIGAAIARIEAARRARISLIARRLQPLEQMRGELLAQFPSAQIRIHAADVTDTAALTTAIENCETEFGPCHRLIASAGIAVPGELMSQPLETFRAQIESNLFGTINAVRAVYPGMARRQSGQIVIISSGAGLIGIHGYTAYCASKHALVGFAEALRQEARPDGISVSICFPPDTETPQLAAEIPLRAPEALAITGLASPWSAARVAGVIVKGADRGRFAIYPGLKMALLGRFGQAIAPILRWYFDRKIAAARKNSGR